MPSENVRNDLRVLDAEEAADQAATEAEQHEDLKRRLAAAGAIAPIPTAAKPGRAIVKDGNAPTETGEEPQKEVDLLVQAAARAKDDKDFAIALLRELQALGRAPHPSYFKPINFFSAKVDFGDAGGCVINVASAGSRNRILLSTRMLEMNNAIQTLAKKAAEYKDQTEVPMQMVMDRNKKIEELGVLQDIDIFGATITNWWGPIFSWPKQAGGGEETMPLLSGFAMDDKEQCDRAIAVYKRVPRKALEMINACRRILDNYGVEDDFAKGNL